jgi:hypothetical protein
LQGGVEINKCVESFSERKKKKVVWKRGFGGCMADVEEYLAASILLEKLSDDLIRCHFN